MSVAEHVEFSVLVVEASALPVVASGPALSGQLQYDVAVRAVVHVRLSVACERAHGSQLLTLACRRRAGHPHEPRAYDQ